MAFGLKPLVGLLGGQGESSPEFGAAGALTIHFSMTFIKSPSYPQPRWHIHLQIVWFSPPLLHAAAACAIFRCRSAHISNVRGTVVPCGECTRSTTAAVFLRRDLLPRRRSACSPPRRRSTARASNGIDGNLLTAMARRLAKKASRTAWLRKVLRRGRHLPCSPVVPPDPIKSSG